MYFIGVMVSFLLTRLTYVNYLKSIGLKYNPNKGTKILGQEMKPFNNIFSVIDKYIETKDLTVGQIKNLRIIKKWEVLNLLAFGLFPIVVIIDELI